ncbi:hypothetical protein ACFCZV_13320 [Streptomyces hydrogenans]|uniref:hypothetical protein n=1 Tax=Streptomyces hydrogenans TaxID=1873719 RepID=UPI0035DA9515
MTQPYRPRRPYTDVNPRAYRAQYQPQIDAATARAEQAEAAIERVRALHTRSPNTGDCNHCSERDYPDYAVPHPCPTIRALDEPQPNDQKDEPR